MTDLPAHVFTNPQPKWKPGDIAWIYGQVSNEWCQVKLVRRASDNGWHVIWPGEVVESPWSVSENRLLKENEYVSSLERGQAVMLHVIPGRWERATLGTQCANGFWYVIRSGDYLPSGVPEHPANVMSLEDYARQQLVS